MSAAKSNWFNITSGNICWPPLRYFEKWWANIPPTWKVAIKWLSFSYRSRQILIFLTRAFCKSRIFVQSQGMQEIYHRHIIDISESQSVRLPADKILSITQSPGEKRVLQMARMYWPLFSPDTYIMSKKEQLQHNPMTAIRATTKALLAADQSTLSLPHKFANSLKKLFYFLCSAILISKALPTEEITR